MLKKKETHNVKKNLPSKLFLDELSSPRQYSLPTLQQQYELDKDSNTMWHWHIEQIESLFSCKINDWLAHTDKFYYFLFEYIIKNARGEIWINVCWSLYIVIFISLWMTSIFITIRSVFWSSSFSNLSHLLCALKDDNSSVKILRNSKSLQSDKTKMSRILTKKNNNILFLLDSIFPVVVNSSAQRERESSI